MKCKYCGKIKKNIKLKTCGDNYCARKAQYDTIKQKGTKRKPQKLKNIFENKSIEYIKTHFKNNISNKNLFRGTKYSTKELYDITFGCTLCEICYKQTKYISSQKGYKTKCGLCSRKQTSNKNKIIFSNKKEIKDYLDKYIEKTNTKRGNGYKIHL